MLINRLSYQEVERVEVVLLQANKVANTPLDIIKIPGDISMHFCAVKTSYFSQKV